MSAIALFLVVSLIHPAGGRSQPMEQTPTLNPRQRLLTELFKKNDIVLVGYAHSSESTAAADIADIAENLPVTHLILEIPANESEDLKSTDLSRHYSEAGFGKGYPRMLGAFRKKGAVLIAADHPLAKGQSIGDLNIQRFRNPSFVSHIDRAAQTSKAKILFVVGAYHINPVYHLLRARRPANKNRVAAISFDLYKNLFDSSRGNKSPAIVFSGGPTSSVPEQLAGMADDIRKLGIARSIWKVGVGPESMEKYRAVSDAFVKAGIQVQWVSRSEAEKIAGGLQNSDRKILLISDDDPLVRAMRNRGFDRITAGALKTYDGIDERPYDGLIEKEKGDNNLLEKRKPLPSGFSKRFGVFLLAVSMWMPVDGKAFAAQAGPNATVVVQARVEGHKLYAQSLDGRIKIELDRRNRENTAGGDERMGLSQTEMGLLESQAERIAGETFQRAREAMKYQGPVGVRVDPAVLGGELRTENRRKWLESLKTSLAESGVVLMINDGEVPDLQLPWAELQLPGAQAVIPGSAHIPIRSPEAGEYQALGAAARLAAAGALLARQPLPVMPDWFLSGWTTLSGVLNIESSSLWLVITRKADRALSAALALKALFKAMVGQIDRYRRLRVSRLAAA